MKIGDCENLRSLPQGMHALSCLTSLVLEDCPALELECFPPLPPKISTIFLAKCPKINSLPAQFHRLECLLDLKIVRCESIARFPDGGLPTQLHSLRVCECGNMTQPVREWLTPLTNLYNLEIDGSAGGAGEVKDLELPLPSSLLFLGIADMEKVERLCSSLPSSVRTFWIERCPKLGEMPRDGFPASLETLWIEGCEVLKERLTGCNRHLIHGIPFVKLKGNNI